LKRAVVAGAGIVGTWHALELCRAGFVVDHLEAERAPLGASVRNFGLLWVSGRRNGLELDVAQRSRRMWEAVAPMAPGIGFEANGSLTLARNADERTVMETFAAHPDARPRSIEFIEPDEVVARNPAIAGEVTGALFCRDDAKVEPRRALGALRAHLESAFDYTFHPRRRISGATDGALIDTAARRWEADIAVIAIGADFDHLSGTEHVGAKVRRVRLQMMETAKWDRRLTTSVADVDTMRYYPAYSVIDRALLGPREGLAEAHHLQLLVVQRADGALTIGDTHAYDEPFDFALCEAPSHELLSRARGLLGAPLPPVVRRWEGIYDECLDGDVCVRAELAERVWLVGAPGGRGMTCAPAIASDTLQAAGVR